LQWGNWSNDLRAEAWCLHCGELLRDALTLTLAPGEQRAIAHAVLRRALAIEPERPFSFIRDLPRSRQVAIVAAVLRQLREGGSDALTGLADQNPDAMLDEILPSTE
jgi:hypothetical protein